VSIALRSGGGSYPRTIGLAKLPPHSHIGQALLGQAFTRRGLGLPEQASRQWDDCPLDLGSVVYYRR
jgi:hypothetical protein